MKWIMLELQDPCPQWNEFNISVWTDSGLTKLKHQVQNFAPSSLSGIKSTFSNEGNIRIGFPALSTN